MALSNNEIKSVDVAFIRMKFVPDQLKSKEEKQIKNS